MALLLFIGRLLFIVKREYFSEYGCVICWQIQNNTKSLIYEVVERLDIHNCVNNFYETIDSTLKEHYKKIGINI